MDARFRRYAFAESAIVTRAAPVMIASLMTSLPAPLIHVPAVGDYFFPIMVLTRSRTVWK